MNEAPTPSTNTSDTIHHHHHHHEEAFTVPTMVSYVAKASPLYEEGRPVPGSAAVASHYLRTGYLWDEVRVRGGAYGAFSSFAPPSEAVLGLVSYRDPHVTETLSVYDGAAGFLGSSSEEEAMGQGNALELQIIGTIGDLDGTVLPSRDQGWVSLMRFLRGESVAARKRWRDEILGTSVKDIQAFGQEIADSWARETSVVVVTSAGALEKANMSNMTNVPIS